jgi:hypothetical protein
VWLPGIAAAYKQLAGNPQVLQRNGGEKEPMQDAQMMLMQNSIDVVRKVRAD